MVKFLVDYKDIVDLKTMKGYVERYDYNETFTVEMIIRMIDDALARNEISESVAEEKNAPDMVNHPSHYSDKRIEVIDYIRDTLTKEGFTEYCGGNVLKYVSRWRHKGGVEDLKKARVYLEWMIESAEKEGSS